MKPNLIQRRRRADDRLKLFAVATTAPGAMGQSVPDRYPIAFGVLLNADRPPLNPDVHAPSAPTNATMIRMPTTARAPYCSERPALHHRVR